MTRRQGKRCRTRHAQMRHASLPQVRHTIVPIQLKSLCDSQSSTAAGPNPVRNSKILIENEDRRSPRSHQAAGVGNRRRAGESVFGCGVRYIYPNWSTVLGWAHRGCSWDARAVPSTGRRRRAHWTQRPADLTTGRL